MFNARQELDGLRCNRSAYYPGVIADLVRAKTHAADDAARVAALPAWARDALNCVEEFRREENNIDLPRGATLITKVELDDFNPIEDTITREDADVRNYYDVIEGCVSRDIDARPRMLMHLSRANWQWISDNTAETIRESAARMRGYGASRSIAMEQARASEIRMLGAYAQIIRDGCLSYSYTVELIGANGDELAENSCGGIDDYEYARCELRNAALSALEQYAARIAVSGGCEAIPARFNITREIIRASGDAVVSTIGEGLALRNAIAIFLASRTRYSDGIQSIECDSIPCDWPRWITSYRGPEYLTGTQESRSLHIPANVSRSTARRIARLLGASL